MLTHRQRKERKSAMKPILFNTKMVRAILDGRKTQTRRVMKPQPYRATRQFKMTMREPAGCWVWEPRKGSEWFFWDDWDGFDPTVANYSPYGRPGDTLWVRETWGGVFKHKNTVWQWRDVPKSARTQENCVELFYKVDDGHPGHTDEYDSCWVPSIFMPRWASRITLKLLDVRVERIQEISTDDAIAEGLTHPAVIHKSFEALWDSLNVKRGYSWQSNPWVWVVTFEVAQC